jgi:glycosyltransferase involved in cell wall biosynthesis
VSQRIYRWPENVQFRDRLEARVIAQHNASMAASISIAMCTYNGAAYVREQLASIASQTRRPDEVVVCDDGSTDQTVAIVRAFAAAADFPVHVHVNERNLGLVGNFSAAFERARGDVVLFCDQDDLWRADKLEKFAAAFGDPGVGLVFADANVVDPAGRAIGHTHWQSVDFTPALQERVNRGEAFDVLLRHSFVACATMGVATRLRPAILPVPAGWHFDAWVAVAAAALLQTKIIAEPLNDYRQHPRQALGGAKKGPWRRYIEARRAVDENYYLATAATAESLRERLLQNGLTAGDARAKKLDEKIRFARSRAAMRRSVLLRYPLLLRELLTGRYHKFGQGFRSVVVDALV